MNTPTKAALATLARLSQSIPETVIGIMSGTVSIEDQMEFGNLLIELGTVVMAEAQEKDRSS